MNKMICFLIVFLFPLRGFTQERKELSPDFLQLQYAGSTGFVSFGAGYDIFHGNARLSAHYGYVPSSLGGELHILSMKLLVTPKNYWLSRRIFVSPFDAGLMISYHLGSDFRSHWPSHRYPKNYYWWQTSYRFHINYQPSLTLTLPSEELFHAITVYLDVNANDLYLVSFAENTKAIDLVDVLMLGAGMRLHF